MLGYIDRSANENWQRVDVKGLIVISIALAIADEYEIAGKADTPRGVQLAVSRPVVGGFEQIIARSAQLVTQ